MEELKELKRSLHPLERKLYPYLRRLSGQEELEKASGLSNVEVVRVFKWLEGKGLIEKEEKKDKTITLDKNGYEYKEKELPEVRFLKAVENRDLDKEELKKKAGLSNEEVNVSIGILKKKNALEVKRSKTGKLTFSITAEGKKLLKEGLIQSRFLQKDFPLSQSGLTTEEKVSLDSLKKRKNIVKVEETKARKAKLTEKGEKLLELGISSEEAVDQLTPEMIKTGKWKNKEFRGYDIQAPVPKISYGKKHFENEVIEYVKRIFLDMGFEEMEGNVIQTEFWDLDSLFVPQDHPAREEQDTFFLSNPNKGRLPKKLFKKVKEAHEGKTRYQSGKSRGWETEFKKEISENLLLRTHTTVLSAQTIAGLKEEQLPAKFFSVGKVFRNETLDWKHLFEFYQVEGIVVDPEANIKNLQGYLKEFFGKMGFEKVRMRPGYFPYTEPSMEVDVYDPNKKEWVELGGSGIFRPEVVKPLLGKEVPVLAWGLGLGRIMAPYFNIKDIREINKNDLKQLRSIKKFMR